MENLQISPAAAAAIAPPVYFANLFFDAFRGLMRDSAHYASIEAGRVRFHDLHNGDRICCFKTGVGVYGLRYYAGKTQPVASVTLDCFDS